MDAQDVRERVLTGGRSLRRFALAAYLLIGLVLVNAVLGFDRSDAFWLNEGEHALYCRVVNATDGWSPPLQVLAGWLIVSERSLEISCRYHLAEQVDTSTLVADGATTRLGITRLELLHDPQGDPGCVEFRGGLLGRISAQSCAETDPR